MASGGPGGERLARYTLGVGEDKTTGCRSSKEGGAATGGTKGKRKMSSGLGEIPVILISDTQ